eukprot:s5433_g1.t1
MFSEDMFDRMDLQMLRSLMPTMTLDEQAELNQPEGHYDSRPPKWQRSGQKGPGNGGKGRHPATPQHSGNAWSGNDWAQRRPQDNRPKHPPQGAFRHSRQQPQDRDHADQMVKQLAELKAINMLTTLVLRQEVQLNIHKQDTAYVLFLNTQGQDSMAGSLFHIGAQWHKTKSEDPTKLTAPVRVIMILSAAEVLTNAGKRCFIVSNARGGAFDDAWVQDLRVGYAFLDAETFVPAWPSAAPATTEKTAKGFFHKRSMFVGGIMDKKERCIDCTRPVWDGHASMKCSKCRTPGGAGSKLHIDAEAAKRVILHTTGVPEPKLSQDAAASNPIISSDSEDRKDVASKPIKADKKEKKLKKLKKVKKEKKDKKKKKKDKDDTSS